MRAIQPHERDLVDDVGPEIATSYVEKALGLGLLLILLSGCVLVLYPFLNAILLAIPLCVSTWPLYTRLQLFTGRRTASAVIMTLAMASILVVPLILLGMNLAEDVTRLNGALRSAIQRGLPPPGWLDSIPLAGAELKRMWLQVSHERGGLRTTLAPYMGPVREWVLRQGASMLGGTVQVALSVVLLFFLYRDGDCAERRLESVMTRLGGWRAKHVLQAGAGTIRSVVIGVVGTAVFQAILLGLSFWLAGVPGALVLGALAVVLSLMPLGLIVLWLPAGLWLLSQEQTGWAIFVLLWNGLVVGTLDNFLRPYLIGRGAELPTVLILFGVLGGVAAFGIVGLFLGPVLLAVAHTMLQDWNTPGDPYRAPTGI